MKVLVSGSRGLVGSALVPALTAPGHSVTRLIRSKTGKALPEILWDPMAELPRVDPLPLFDGVVHLAGDNIAEGRWTAEKKKAIFDSRAKGTRLLAETLAAMKDPPKVFITASAVGFYGDRGSEILTEESAPGSNFLADVCREWEAAAEPARQRGIRTVHLRFGMILSSEGGALGKMLIPFKMGVGGKLGDGRQYISWIAIDDVVEVILMALFNPALSGPVNAVSPNPVTNVEFTSTLGKVLSRPTIFPMPAFAARLAFGEVADDVLLASTRAVPSRLLAAGYVFRYPDIEGALRHVLTG